MIEKFTPEELAIIIDELAGNGAYALDKKATSTNAVMQINNALSGMYGNKYDRSCKEQVRHAVHLLADYALGNVKFGNYGITRNRAVCVNPQKYREAVDEIAKVITSIASASDYKGKAGKEEKAAPERENGGLFHSALVKRLEEMKGADNE